MPNKIKYMQLNKGVLLIFSGYNKGLFFLSSYVVLDSDFE